MSWAVTVEGRSDPGGIVLLLEDRSEAESIARDLRGRGTMVEVRLYRAGTRPQGPPAGVTGGSRPG